ncbi:MAG: thioredoxin [Bacteroidota bacterium]
MDSFKQIIGGDKPVLVDFYADWCMPCRMLGPILQDLAADLGDELRILKIDVDKNPEVASGYGIFSVPTLLLFHRGQMVWKGSGAKPKEELKRIIKSHQLRS